MKIAEKSLTGAGQFTDWKSIQTGSYVDYSISGTFTATVTLQRVFETTETAKDVDSWTAEMEGCFYVPSRMSYRLGIKSGDYTSGTADVVLALGQANWE